MAVELPPPERDHRTIGSLKRTYCAWLLSPERMKLAHDRRTAHPGPRRVVAIGVPCSVLIVLIGPGSLQDFLGALLTR